MGGSYYLPREKTRPGQFLSASTNRLDLVDDFYDSQELIRVRYPHYKDIIRKLFSSTIHILTLNFVSFVLTASLLFQTTTCGQKNASKNQTKQHGENFQPDASALRRCQMSWKTIDAQTLGLVACAACTNSLPGAVLTDLLWPFAAFIGVLYPFVLDYLVPSFELLQFVRLL